MVCTEKLGYMCCKNWRGVTVKEGNRKARKMMKENLHGYYEILVNA
jgi:hypothetical protein